MNIWIRALIISLVLVVTLSVTLLVGASPKQPGAREEYLVTNDALDAPAGQSPTPPAGLKHVLLDNCDSTPLMKLDELAALQAQTPDPAIDAYLRQYLRRPGEDETIRNEMGKVLIAWKSNSVAEEFESQACSEAHSDLWRAFCVQLIEHDYICHENEVSLAHLYKLADSASSAVRNQAVFSLASIALAKDWRAARPERHGDLARRVNDGVNAIQQTRYDDSRAVNLIATAALLRIEECLLSIERIAADTSRELSVRVAAVNAIGDLGNLQSVDLLTKISAVSDSPTLIDMARLAISKLTSSVAK